MSLLEKIAHMIGDRKIPVPAMPGVPRFRISFANRHIVKIIFFTVLVSLAAVGTGMYFTIRDVVSATYNWPTPATYDVTEHGLQKMGQKNPKMPDGSESQTLSIRLGDGVRISTLRIKDTDAGRTGIPRSLNIGPYTTAVTGAQAYLWVGNLTITNSSFPSLEWVSSEVGTLNMGMLCDGHTNEATIVNTIPDLELSSERGSSTYEASNIVDKTEIFITGNNGAYINNLILDNYDAWNGAAYLSRIKASVVNIDNSNRIGDGSGIDDASCEVKSSVKARHVNSTIQDRPIKVR
ncbi:hypothetical protein [uncultured Mediterranean phage uvDeep-CGR2-KM23-C198]|nr:hypothetical protein [uncultured Mediterranean phage uvDeep-CGR2-KM23-C198]